MSKIFFPTDFSENAKNALDFAVPIAEKMKAELILFHVYPAPAGDMYMAATQVQEMIEDRERQAKKQITELQKEIEGKSDIKISTKIKSGFVVGEILWMAEQIKADLIILGTKGAGNFESKIIGSNTSNILRETNLPVLAIPEKAVYSGIRKIAFAAALSAKDIKAENDLIKFARLFDAEIIIVHVEEEKTYDVKEIKVAEKLQNAYDKVQFKVLRNKNIEKALDEFVQQKEVDILAMLTRKRNFFERLFVSSHTKHIAFQAELPLLAFHE